jgi:hypothetical protein
MTFYNPQNETGGSREKRRFMTNLFKYKSELLVVDVQLPGSTIAFRVVAIYRSPIVSELSTFNNQKILQYLSSVFLSSSKFRVVTDFNPPCIDWTSSTTRLSDDSFESQFLQTLQENYLYQHIHNPTR